jgi:hypothetical protein
VRGALLGSDDALTLHMTAGGKPVRTIANLGVGERENGSIQIYGGVHFSFNSWVGQQLGCDTGWYALTETDLS